MNFTFKETPWLAAGRFIDISITFIYKFGNDGSEGDLAGPEEKNTEILH
jgi:hypothetical protein